MLRLFKCYVKICMPNKAERVGMQSMVLSVGNEPGGQEEVPRQNRCMWASLTQQRQGFSTLHSVKAECGAQPDFFWSGNREDFAQSYSSPSIKLITPI